MDVRMKYIIIALCLIMPSLINAKDVESLHASSRIKSLQLKEVVCSDSLTLLHLEWDKSECGIARCEGLYLSDSKCRTYSLLHSEVSYKSKEESAKDSVVSLRLYFEPFPGKEELFDLLHSNDWCSEFNHWGIHSEDCRLPFSVIPDSYKEYSDSTLVRPGEAYIRGHLVDVQGHKLPEEIVLNYQAFVNPAREGKGWKKIREDGIFETRCSLDGHAWLFCETVGLTIPMYVIPGDTVDVFVHNPYSSSRTIVCFSKNNKDTHDALMNAVNHLVDTEGTFSDIDVMGQYLTWKYGMNDYEKHLLVSYMQARNAFETWYLAQSNSKEGLLLEEDGAYTFLKHTDWQDLSFHALPFYTYIKIFSSMLPLIRKIGNDGFDAAMEMLEKYSGRPLGSAWKKVLRVILAPYYSQGED